MKNALSERAKHRLRLAARFLRLEGQRFNKGEFYPEVLGCITTLNLMQQERYVNWSIGWRNMKLKNKSGLTSRCAPARRKAKSSLAMGVLCTLASPTQKPKHQLAVTTYMKGMSDE